MRRIPTAEQKEELKRLLKQQYEDTVASIDRDEGLDPACADGSLSDEIEKTRKQIYEEVHIGKRSCGWTGETYDEWERKRGHYPPFPCAGYEHVTPAGLRFARDADFC